MRICRLPSNVYGECTSVKRPLPVAEDRDIKTNKRFLRILGVFGERHSS